MDQQIGLQLGDARPIPHVAGVFRPLKLLSRSRAAGWRCCAPPSRTEVRYSSRRVLSSWPNACIERGGVFPDAVEHALLALDPAQVLAAKQPVEQPVRNHLRGQRTVARGPAHVPLNAFAERFLADTDLQRAEARIVADLLRDNLIDGRSARAASGERFARHQRAHGAVMAVGRSGCRVR